jgi:hypothetical protein
MSGVRQPTPEIVERRIGRYHTIAGVNPIATALKAEAERLAVKPDETNEKAVQRTFTYVQQRQNLRHGQEWKDAEQAVLGLLSEVRKHQEGER